MLNTIRDVRKKILRPWGMGETRMPKEMNILKIKREYQKLKLGEQKYLKATQYMKRYFISSVSKEMQTKTTIIISLNIHQND